MILYYYMMENFYLFFLILFMNQLHIHEINTYFNFDTV